MTYPAVPLAEPAPCIGHNRSPEALDPVATVKRRLSVTHRELVARFVDLELGCARVPTDGGAPSALQQRPRRGVNSAKSNSTPL
jgi:hypothetical protein